MWEDSSYTTSVGNSVHRHWYTQCQQLQNTSHHVVCEIESWFIYCTVEGSWALWWLLGPSSTGIAFTKNVLVITNKWSWRIFACVYPVFTIKYKCKNHSKATFTLVLFLVAWIIEVKITPPQPIFLGFWLPLPSQVNSATTATDFYLGGVQYQWHRGPMERCLDKQR